MASRRSGGRWERWPEHQKLEARAVDNSTGAALVFATFHATAIAGPVSQLQLATALGTAVRVGVPLAPQPVIGLADKYGNAIKQQGVNIAAALTGSTNQSLGGVTTVATDANGLGANNTSCSAEEGLHDQVWGHRRDDSDCGAGARPRLV